MTSGVDGSGESTAGLLSGERGLGEVVVVVRVGVAGAGGGVGVLDRAEKVERFGCSGRSDTYGCHGYRRPCQSKDMKFELTSGRVLEGHKLFLLKRRKKERGRQW